MTALLTNYAASNLTVASTPAINGCPWSVIKQGGWESFTSNGSTLDCFGFPGFSIFSGDISGTPGGALTINNNAVTLAKQANGTANSLQGFNNSGAASVITTGNGLAVVGGVLTTATPVVVKTTDYTVQASDAGTMLVLNSGSAHTFTGIAASSLGTDASVCFGNEGAGALTLSGFGTIIGLVSNVLPGPGGAQVGDGQVCIVSDGTNYHAAQGQVPPDGSTIAVVGGKLVATAGGSLGVTFTDGTHTVASATQLTVTGGTVGGTTPNATLTVTAGGGLGTLTDGTHTQTSVTTLSVGNGFLTTTGSSGTAPLNLTFVDTAKTSSYSAAAGDMGYGLTLGGSSGTLTLPAVSSTVFAPGMTLAINVISSGSWTITNSTGLTMQGLNTTTLPKGTQGTFVASGDGTHLTFYPGAQPPSATAIGAVLAVDCSSGSQFIQKVNTDGSETCASPPSAAATPLSAGTSATLTGPQAYYVCTGTCSITVPVPAAGVEFCVMNDDNVSTVITLLALGSSARYENQARTAYGAAGTGTLVSAGAVGDKVCILGRDATHYLTTTTTGTWVAS
jgi:hypothetical protein